MRFDYQFTGLDLQDVNDQQLAVLLARDCDLEAAAQAWDADVDPNDYEWRLLEYGWPEDNDGLTVLRGVLHPASLDASRLIFVIEYRVTGTDPFIELSLDNGPVRTDADSRAIPGDADWRRLILVANRDEDGDAFGDCQDMLTYRVRDVEVRLFQVANYGLVGDLNFDGGVNSTDLQIVLSNFGATGTSEVQQGDANVDGDVDYEDANIVLDQMVDD